MSNRGALLLLLVSACGLPTGSGTSGAGRDAGIGACVTELDCELGGHCEHGFCVEGVADAGFICTREDDCKRGLVCLRSKGECVEPTPLPDAGEVDAGIAPLCQPDLEQSCGTSKLGECRLGISRCEPDDAGLYAFSACLGAIGPRPEVCDGKDNDCDGLTDDDLPDVSCGVGVCARTVASCVGGVASLCVPGAPGIEVCNGLDDDCDGSIDEGLQPLTCGVGMSARSVVACNAGAAQQCVAAMSSSEQCNGRDDDCNGLVDDGLPTATCGTGACARTVETCVGGHAQTCTPGGPQNEICNGLDDDCNGQMDEGFGTIGCGVGQCARVAQRCVSGTVQVCTPGLPVAELCDGLDNDCNSLVDDGLGTVGCGVGLCHRTQAVCAGGIVQTCTPGVPGVEICDGQDNDCDGQIDEDQPAVSCGLGVCLRSQPSCVSGVPQVCTPGPSSVEICDGIDNNCNGITDEGCQCVDGATRNCYGGPSGTRNVGRCLGGVETCVSGQWAGCVGQVLPGTEVCNSADDDCDAQIDEGLGSISCGAGACVRTVDACVAGSAQACSPGSPSAELCNGLDDDCDGQVDEGLPSLSCGVGACARSMPSCVGGVTQVCTPGMSTAEVCDGVDNDCDGETDEGFAPISCGVGACSRTIAACVSGVGQTCVPGAPTSETCDGVDNNCNGQIDEGFGSASCGIGACARTVQTCAGGVPRVCVPGASAAETCNGADDDCDGLVDEGTCGPLGTCPMSRTVNPNTTVTLTTAASSPVGRAVTCAWSVLSRPATSNGTFSAPMNCTNSSYFADVVGTHVLRFSVTDASGLSATCDTSIAVLPLGDLWVELTWNVNNDMDLHLLHPSAGPAHSASSWMKTQDCYYRNKTPSWDAVGSADDPSLDRDDIPGRGPENTRINVPSTTHPYVIGVHMYSYVASPAPVTATLRLYCGGQLRATQVRTFSTNKQMWVVGEVDFANAGAAACIFTPDGATLQVP